MKIKVQNYKNLKIITHNENDYYEIDDNALNLLVGISGSGKTAIIDAIQKKENEFNKSVYSLPDDEVVSSIKYGNINDEQELNLDQIKIFNNDTISKYLFTDEDKESLMYNILVDDENNTYQKSKQELDIIWKEFSNKLDECKNNFDILDNLVNKKLKFKIDKRNGQTAKPYILKKIVDNIKELNLTTEQENILKEIISNDVSEFNWLLEGKKIHENNHVSCKFCKNTIPKDRWEELKKYESFDEKLLKNFTFTPQERTLLDIDNISTFPFQKNEDGKYILTTKLDSVQKCLEKFKELEQINDDKQIVDDKDFIIDNDLLKSFDRYFPSLYEKFKILVNSNEENLKIYNTLKTNTNNIIEKNTNELNNAIKKMGIPYKFEAYFDEDKEIKENKLKNIRLIHVYDKEKKERTVGLSEGEKKVISLILFILNFSKNKNNPNTIDPKFIIFDDPVSSYDENRRLSIFNFLIENFYKKNKTLLVLSHDQSFVQYLYIPPIPEKYKDLHKDPISEKRCKLKGRISYVNILPHEQTEIIDIQKNDVGSLEFFIREKIKLIPNDEYLRKIINLRLYYDLRKKSIKNEKPYSNLMNDCYNYFTNILHLINDKENKSRNDEIKEFENKYYKKDEQKFDLPYDNFWNLEVYNDANLVVKNSDKWSVLEKVCYIREITNDDNNEKAELDNMVHLNTKNYFGLNPYKFPFCSRFVIEYLIEEFKKLNQ